MRDQLIIGEHLECVMLAPADDGGRKLMRFRSCHDEVRAAAALQVK